VVPFHKQWGASKSNPLVVKQGITIEDAKRADRFGKGGGLIDGVLVRKISKACRIAAIKIINQILDDIVATDH
jgi:hypothetical protein